MLLHTPTVSIVIPTYNRSAKLIDAVESVLHQDHDSLEIIVVDDASEVPEAIDGINDDRVRLVRRATNGGVAAAQNTGLAEARGEFVAFLHSDDRLLPGSISHRVNAISAHPSTLGVEAPTVRLTAAGPGQVGPLLRTASFEQILRREVRNYHISGFLFRRRALEEAGGFEERLRSYEDFELILRLRRSGEFCFVDLPACEIDQRPGDRLAESPWMPKARSTLLDLYEEELIERFGRLPDHWRHWSIQLAVDAAANGDGAAARAELRRGCRHNTVESLRRIPFWAATHLGSASSRRAAATTRRRWSLQR
jgi:glycosyltransferase involved in cell wall biosynthesis